jgi:hypothetical protein
MRRLTPVLLVAAALLVLASSASACIKRHSVPVASGLSPSGLEWKVEGTIGDNGNACREWLFGMNFDFVGEWSWGSGTGIPAGGHLGRHPEPSAFDRLLDDGSDRVFAGFVSGETAKVLVTLSDNKRLTIHPKSAPAPLRRKNVWLRDVRYFVDFYRPEGFVTQVSTFDASGRLLYRDRNFEGF